MLSLTNLWNWHPVAGTRRANSFTNGTTIWDLDSPSRFERTARRVLLFRCMQNKSYHSHNGRIQIDLPQTMTQKGESRKNVLSTPRYK